MLPDNNLPDMGGNFPAGHLLCGAGCADPTETARQFCIEMGHVDLTSFTTGTSVPWAAYWCGENGEICESTDPLQTGWQMAATSRPSILNLMCNNREYE